MAGRATIQQYKFISAVLELYRQDKSGAGFTFRQMVQRSGINEHTARSIFKTIRPHMRRVEKREPAHGHPKYTVAPLAAASGALTDLRLSIFENLSEAERSKL